MDDTNSLIEQRKAKLDSLRGQGHLPVQKQIHAHGNLRRRRATITLEGREVAVAGRITAHRDMGKSMFIDVRDQSGRLQMLRAEKCPRRRAVSDFHASGPRRFRRRQGHAVHHQDRRNFHQARPASPFSPRRCARRPAKWHGLEDTEIRYRQRYLDLIANPDVKDVMLKRSAIIHEIRNFFHGRGYVEVETPVMQAIPGGAAAQPFKTYHNALGCEFYLRIALELYHKRLLVGGMDRLFEIGKNFRNEGLSRRHNPEFTMLEAYCAFGDYATMMETVESLITTVAQKVLGTLKIPRTEHKKSSALQLKSSLDNLDNRWLNPADISEQSEIDQLEKRKSLCNSEICAELNACA